jgi:hypothetical protein
MRHHRLHPCRAFLDALCPLIARPADHARCRSDQHERANDVWMRGRKQHRQGAALGDRDHCRLIRARLLEHRTNVIDLLLQRGRPGDPAGHPGATPIKLNQPRERRKPREQPCRRRYVPIELNVREPPRHDQHIERPVTGQLVGDLHITTTRVPCDDFHPGSSYAQNPPAGCPSPRSQKRDGRRQPREPSDPPSGGKRRGVAKGC